MFFLKEEKPFSAYQFAAFRIIFGGYLLFFFLKLGARGQNDLFFYGANDSYFILFIFLFSLGALFFMVGLLRRVSAVILWGMWALFWWQNSAMSHPSIPYIAFLLFLCVFIPEGEALSLQQRFSKKPSQWKYPGIVYWLAWGLLAMGYILSGVMKLGSSNWRDGIAVQKILESPLAREGWIRDVLLQLPGVVLSIITWGVMILEIGFLLASFHWRTRLWAWVAMLPLHFATACVLVGFGGFFWGMLMMHLFVLDPDWFPSKKPVPKGRHLVFFDGICLLCEASIQFFLKEDHGRVLRYAPLQGETAADFFAQKQAELPEGHQTLTSIVFVKHQNIPREVCYTKSAAVLHILDCVGGFWRIVSWLRIIPRWIRDPVYDFIAKHRYRWFGKKEEACFFPQPEERELFLD